MNEWLHAMLQASWQGGVVIVAAWLLARWCKFLSPRVACWIWRLACLKLLVCFAVNWVGVQAVAIPVLPADRPAAIAVTAETSPSALVPAKFPRQSDAIALARPSAPPLPPIAAPQPGNSNWLLLVWLAGVGCAVVLTIGRWRSVRRLCRNSQPLQIAELETLSREEAARLGLKRLPRIHTSPQTGAPLLAGILRPVLLLPASAIAEFNQHELRLILAHELAHLKRHDLLWNWLPTVAGWLFCFHPLVWLLKHCWAAAQESACDELVLQSRIGEAAAYAGLLIKVAANWPQEATFALMAAGVSGGYRNLRRRILLIVGVKAVSHRHLLFAGAIAALAAVVAIVPWRLAAQEPKADAAQAAPKAAPPAESAPRSGELAPGTSPKKDAYDWREIQRETAPLLAAMSEHSYRLDDGQILRRIPPPYPAVRNEFVRASMPRYFDQLRNRFGKNSPEEVAEYRVTVQKFVWSHDHLTDSGYRGGFERIPDLLEILAGIRSQSVEGPRTLLRRYVPGDWVVREGASDVQIVDSLSAILRSEFSLRVHMEFRQAVRTVYIAEGTYRYQPLPLVQGRERSAVEDRQRAAADSRDFIDVYAKDPATCKIVGSVFGCPYPKFLDYLGDWVHAPILSDVKVPPTKRIRLYYNEHRPSTNASEADDHDPALVLPNITAQTGLTFRKETRMVRMLFVEETK